jgi:hypothetical protein
MGLKLGTNESKGSPEEEPNWGMTPKVGRGYTVSMTNGGMEMTYSKAFSILVGQVQLIRLGADTEVVEHNIPLGIGEIIWVKLLGLGSLDLGCVFGIIVGLVVARSRTTGDILKVGDHLLCCLCAGRGVGGSLIWVVSCTSQSFRQRTDRK